ncbi:ROK family transcriptional regulator [Salinispira pacifica]|uniref:Xylose-responsive transcription regulator, ROK family n=1 Tax=Salinispira pacifica TaxID=1307761 RepID=V5WFB7_9SPIO|nr:ROK family transcriptional regulator [Salinispira pacifica]AHC14488.1 Xylose-responsive transcription regulator, ROK family [Salinispira pacifica]
MKDYTKGEKTSLNFHRVLNSIWLNEGVSRVELSRELNLDKATVSVIVSSLMNNNLVLEAEKQNTSSRPGRQPVGLEINRCFGAVAGIELHIDRINCVISDMHHNILDSISLEGRVDRKNIDYKLLSLIDHIKKLKSLNGMPLLGAAVAIPGLVDSENGIILKAPAIGLWDESYDFSKRVAARADIPVLLINDANACASGILSSHRRNRYDSFLFVYLGFDPVQDKLEGEVDHPGIGLGIVLNGKLHMGPKGSAGEFQTIGYRSNRVNQFNLTLDEIHNYRHSEEIQIKVADDIASHLGFLVNVLNIEQIFLGGDLAYYHPSLEGRLKRAIDESWPYDKPVPCAVNFLYDEHFLPAKGAAGMLLDRLFSIPDVLDENNLAILKDAIKTAAG